MAIRNRLEKIEQLVAEQRRKALEKDMEGRSDDELEFFANNGYWPENSFSHLKAPDGKFWPDCICFPCKPTFWSEQHASDAKAVTCPRHGARLSNYELTFYRPRWARKHAPMPDIESVPEDIRTQYVKAFMACSGEMRVDFIAHQ